MDKILGWLDMTFGELVYYLTGSFAGILAVFLVPKITGDPLYLIVYAVFLVVLPHLIYRLWKRKHEESQWQS